MSSDQSRTGVDIPDESDASPEVRVAFWSLVVLFNLAILAIAVGAMLVGFRGRLTAGGGLLLAGALAFGVGIYRLRGVQDRLGGSPDDGGDPG